MKHIVPLYLATCLAAFAGTGPAVQETITIPTAESSEWRVRTALYGWAQSLEGDVTVRGITAPVDLKFKDIAEDLDMAAMGLIEVNHGRWGVLLDVNYADISDSVSGSSRRAPSIDFNQKQWLINGYLTYNVLKNESTVFDVLGGARFNAIEVDLGINDRDFSRDTCWVDPVVGFRFQQTLTSQFFFRAVGDIGGFDISSDLTWQGMVGFGWKFTENCNALLGYRAIDTDYSHKGFGYDICAHGPVIGVEISF